MGYPFYLKVIDMPKSKGTAKRTSPKVAKKASKLMQTSKSATVRAVAASALAQAGKKGKGK